MKVVLKLITVVLTLSGSTHINGYPSEAPLIETFRDSVPERVVTNYTDVLNGVPVEHGYSECFSESWLREGSKDGLCSVPGRPKSEAGIPWIYYGNTQKCYLAGQKGPCKYYEVLKIVNESPYGICSCSCLNGIIQSLEEENVEVCRTDQYSEYTFIPRENKCFKLMTEGPCKSHHWLVKSENTSEIICEMRTCPEGQIIMSFNGDPYCEKDSPVTISAIGGGVQLLKSDCPEGSRYSNLLKRCIAKLSFNDKVFNRKIYKYVG